MLDVADDEDEDDDGEEDIDAVLRKIAALKEGGLFGNDSFDDEEVLLSLLMPPSLPADCGGCWFDIGGMWAKWLVMTGCELGVAAAWPGRG